MARMDEKAVVRLEKAEMDVCIERCVMERT